MLPLLIGAAVGAGVGILSSWSSRKRQKAEIERQREAAWKTYEYGKQLSDTQYGLQKGEALWQLGMQKRTLREGMGQFTDEYKTHLLERAYGEQDAGIQTASGVGGSLAQEAMSGTRGNEANQLTRDYANNRLERQTEVQRKQDANTLAGTIDNANRSVSAMGHERASWDPGGYRYESKTANDLYNRQMADLGQAGYQWQLNDMNSLGSKILDYTGGFFGGASSGLSVGKTIKNFKYDWW